MKYLLTCWGRARRCCGQAHTTLAEAETCIATDRTMAVLHDEKSDREIRVLTTEKELEGFDPEVGPGVELAIVAGLEAIRAPAGKKN
jgi:hypothetical protein